MKRTVIFWLAALFAIASLSAQEVKPARYIINGKVVREFDGSQLVGQTITHYRLDGEHNAHIIFTSAYQGDAETMKKEAQAALDGVTKGKISALTIHDGEAKPKADQFEENIYVINGKVVPYSEFKELSSNKIVSMTVIKNKQNPDFVKYVRDAVKYAGVDPKASIIITVKP